MKFLNGQSQLYVWFKRPFLSNWRHIDCHNPNSNQYFKQILCMIKELSRHSHLHVVQFISRKVLQSRKHSYIQDVHGLFSHHSCPHGVYLRWFLEHFASRRFTVARIEDLDSAWAALRLGTMPAAAARPAPVLETQGHKAVDGGRWMMEEIR